ncbi:dephospho-CoA kinase [Candidatus Soleaferrea massiliensis]|uniref:dephospho-CoA kinase n=1 Tax=Candidatus Soleaferrea massiliensis TaxID=1470354 RepID=UPI00058E9724|nr:dephospho-CoA kinase [Candidatus Soleaferrea massiliensis]
MIIGLTGPTGAGKTTVSGMLETYGVQLIDCDRLAREVVMPGRPCLREIRDVFGAGVLHADGSLDRSALADMVFTDSQQLQKLNDIMFSAIINEIKLRIRQLNETGAHILIDAPTLFESGAHRLCDIILVVLGSEENRMKRIVERDHLSEQNAGNRMRAQHAETFYRQRADFVIENNGSLSDLKRQAACFAKQYDL